MDKANQTSKGLIPLEMATQLWRTHFFKLLLCGIIFATLYIFGIFQIVNFFPFDFSDPDKWAESQMKIAAASLLFKCLFFSLFIWVIVILISRPSNRNLRGVLKIGFRATLVATSLYLVVSLKPVLTLWIDVEYQWVSWLIYIPMIFLFVKLSGVFGWVGDNDAKLFSRWWRSTNGQESEILKLWLVTAFAVFLFFVVLFALLNFGQIAYSDRAFGTTFFKPQHSQDSLLWLQHLFWFFNHIEVQLQLVFLISFGFLITASSAVYQSLKPTVETEA